MKTKIFKIMLLLLVVVAFSSNAAEDKSGYHIRVTWIGDANVELIWRNPKGKPIYGTKFEDLDCYYGQKNPDWGIIGQDFDDPKWISATIGETNIQTIVANTIMDGGIHTIIARITDGNAICNIDKIRINDKDINERTTKPLNADDCNVDNDQIILQINPEKEILNSKVEKFKQNIANNKFLIKLNYSSLPEEITTNDIVRLFLNSEQVYSDNNWESNNKQTKFFIDKPWTLKIIKNKNFIYIRGLADYYYRRITVNASLFIGNTIYTNTFLTDQRAKYKYKDPK